MMLRLFVLTASRRHCQAMLELFCLERHSVHLVKTETAVLFLFMSADSGKLQEWIPFVVTECSGDERYLLSAGGVGSTDSEHFTEQAANFSVKVTNQLLLAIHLLQSD